MNQRKTSLVLLLLTPFAALAAAAQAPTYEASAAIAHGSVLRLAGDAVQLDLAGAEDRRLAVPDGVRVEAIARGTDRWWLAGSESRPEGGERLWLAEIAGDGEAGLEARPLPAADGSWQHSPLPLLAGGDLVGLAWLEGAGESSLSVHAARRSGDTWSEPVEISPPGPGSQLALAATALTGGDLLLAWSAFDGEDDEILWSRFSEGAWSEPRPLHGTNGVPDVTPALTEVDGVPTAVWSRYTPAGYTLYGARLEASGWVELGPVAAPGSLFPSFAQAPGGQALIYRQAFPRGWGIAQVAPGGRILRLLHSTGEERPVPVFVGSDQVILLPEAGAEEVQRLAWEPRP